MHWTNKQTIGYLMAWLYRVIGLLRRNPRQVDYSNWMDTRDSNGYNYVSMFHILVIYPLNSAFGYKANWQSRTVRYVVIDQDDIWWNIYIPVEDVISEVEDVISEEVEEVDHIKMEIT